MYKILMPVAATLSAAPLIAAVLNPTATLGDHILAATIFGTVVGLLIGDSVATRHRQTMRSELAERINRDAETAQARHERWKAEDAAWKAKLDAAQTRRDEEDERRDIEDQILDEDHERRMLNLEQTGVDPGPSGEAAYILAAREAESMARKARERMERKARMGNRTEDAA